MADPQIPIIDPANPEVLERVPYNEDGKQLSFKTLAKTVYMDDGSTLEEYINSVLANVQEGQAGRGITGTDVYYAIYPRECTSLLDLLTYTSESGWIKNSSPSVTDTCPNLWKKTIVHYNLPPLLETLYEFCGSLGQDGIDGPGSEWIYKSSSEKLNVSNEETNINSEYGTDAFNVDDYVPVSYGWEDDLSDLSKEYPYQYTSKRKKINGVWGRFSTPRLIGQLPTDADGIVTNNIFAVGDSAPELPNIDDITFIDGNVIGLTGGWEDSIQNSWNTQIIWMAICSFSLTTGQCFKIQTPIKITGENGVGSDGNGVEFVYFVTDQENVTDFDLGTLRANGAKQFRGSAGKWTDHPEAIDSHNRFQYVSIRTGHYNGPDDWKWGDYTNETVGSAPTEWNYGWSDPMPWSMWGADGIDGDGVQYVYIHLTEQEFRFVDGHPERWNFDGGFSGTDPGTGGSGGSGGTGGYSPDDPNNPENNDPNNPANPHIYELKNTNVIYPLTVLCNEVQIVLMGQTIYKHVYNPITGDEIFGSSGKPIEFTADIIVDISDSINLTEFPIEEATAKFRYTDGESYSINEGTVTFKRGANTVTNHVYTIRCLEQGTNSFIDSFTKAWQTEDGINEVIHAPVLEGYTVASATPVTIEQILPGLLVTFYYTKNS